MIDSTVVQDVVIVIPGIMGSELVDADGRPVWSVSAGALTRAIRSFGKSLKNLELPIGLGDEAPHDGIRATSLLTSLHVVPGLWSPIIGYNGLLNFLRSARFHLVEPSPGNTGLIPNLISFPYDWRLSNRYNGRLLAEVAVPALERWRRQPGMHQAQLVLVCHSMGGLVARWFAEQEGGAELIRALITIGTPYRGALKSALTLVNGLDPGIGPLRLPLTAFARSLPSMYQLLPQYDCLITDDGRADLITGHCPGLDASMLRDATAFHRDITGRADTAYESYKVVGIRQPTPTTAQVSGALLVPSGEIDGHNQGGDGTVPRLAAELLVGRGKEVHEIAEQHGELQSSRSLLDLVDGILSREQIVWQNVPAGAFGVEMDDVMSTRDEIVVRVTNLNNRRLLVTLYDETDHLVGPPTSVSPDGTASVGRLPEGGYRAVVGSGRPGGPPPISKPFLVIDPGVGV